MLIGVDGTCWANERGYGRFAREIVAAMARIAPNDQFVCFVDAESAKRFSVNLPNARNVHVDTGVAASHAASASGYRSPFDMFSMSRAVARAKVDVFFSPSVYTYFPLPLGLPAVITIHDAIAERFPALTVPSMRGRLFWTIKVRLALMQATRVLTVSRYAAADIEKVHRVRRDRLDIASEAPAEAFVPRDADVVCDEARKAGLPDGARWFIYVGGFNPHKNVPSILRAHAAVASASKPEGRPHLLLVGTLTDDVFFGDLTESRATVDRLGTSELVHWTGFVPDEELSALHTGAIALVIPSEAEGFGLPAVEAAACGAPVIATTESPLPELLADGGIFVQPGNDAELTAAMERLASDEQLQKRMGTLASQRASLLTWERGARSALDSLRAAART